LYRQRELQVLVNDMDARQQEELSKKSRATSRPVKRKKTKKTRDTFEMPQPGHSRLEPSIVVSCHL